MSDNENPEDRFYRLTDTAKRRLWERGVPKSKGYWRFGPKAFQSTFQRVREEASIEARWNAARLQIALRQRSQQDGGGAPKPFDPKQRYTKNRERDALDAFIQSQALTWCRTGKILALGFPAPRHPETVVLGSLGLLDRPALLHQRHRGGWQPAHGGGPTGGHRLDRRGTNQAPHPTRRQTGPQKPPPADPRDPWSADRRRRPTTERPAKGHGARNTDPHSARPSRYPARGPQRSVRRDHPPGAERV